MTTQTTPAITLLDQIWPKPSAFRMTALLAIGIALLTVSSKIQIPFYPVLFTMQTFVVLVMPIVYGWRLGSMTIIAYLFAGMVGMPVFAGTPEKGIGIAYMAGPTGGYLMGFIVAGLLTGYLAERGWDRSVIGTFAAMVVGNVAIYLCGIAWLGSLVGWDKPLLQWGVIPFLLGDLVKILLAMMILPTAWKVLKK